LITAAGEVLLAGTISADPQPIVAQVCTACGYIELYAPLPLNQTEIVSELEEPAITETVEALAPAA
jgi:hypothetical protein